MFHMTKEEIEEEKKNPKVEITESYTGDNVIILCWSSKIGFGQFRFRQVGGQFLCVDNEHMSIVYVKAVLQKWIDSMIFDPVMVKQEEEFNAKRKGFSTCQK